MTLGDVVHEVVMSAALYVMRDNTIHKVSQGRTFR